jgi:hypothetical protein
MKQIRNILVSSLLMFGLIVLMSSCEKDKHVPPNISLKTGTGYSFANATVAKNSAITVGLIAEKVEDDMISYNVSVAYDGATTTTTYQNFNLSGTEQQHYDKDVSFTTRNQPGSEKWTFTITDKDGNIAQKQIVLTVE